MTRAARRTGQDFASIARVMAVRSRAQPGHRPPPPRRLDRGHRPASAPPDRRHPHRPEAQCSLRASHAARSISGSEMRWPIHLFSTGRLRAERPFLVHLIVVERAVVRHDHQQRDPVVRRGPQRGHAHQEVAVAQDRDAAAGRCPARPAPRRPRCRGRRRSRRPRRAEIVERMAERPVSGVPDQRQMQQRHRRLAHRGPQHMRQRARSRSGRRPRHRWSPASPALRSEWRHATPSARTRSGTTTSGVPVQQQIDRRERLMVHAPAVVQVVVERHLDHLGRRAYRRQAVRSVPPRSTQSRLRITSASA